MTFSKDFLVGIFVIIAFILIAATTVFLRHWDPLSRQHTFYANFSQVQKLDVGAPVLVSARRFLERHGRDALSTVAKLHFKTTQQILG